MNRFADRRAATKGQIEAAQPSPAEVPDALFRASADDAPVMLWLAGPDNRCTFFNREWLEFTGRTLSQELGWGWLEGVHRDDRQTCIQRSRQAFKAREPFTLEYRLRRADGRYRWMLGHGSPRIDAGGVFRGYAGSCADITDRKAHDGAEAQAERMFQRLIENAHDLVYRTRVLPTTSIEYIGGAVEEITGHTALEFYADPELPAKAIHPDDVHHHLETMRDPAHLKAAVTLRWVHANGTIVWAEHRRVPVYDASGTLIAVEGIARDVTERVETQRRLRESQEQMRQLAARIQTAREEERATIARELHDELGQTLTAIKLELGRTTGAMNDSRVTPVVIDRLQSLIGLVEIGIETVKRITTSLRPPTLDHLGLPDAVRWEAMTFRSRTGLRCHVRADKEVTALSAEQQTALFRIFQEALTNVVRHARASAVHVTLAERRGEFELRIRDNGCGVTDAQLADPHAIGLLGMRERAALVGGTFVIAGRRGKGTSITVRVPLTASQPRRMAVRRRRPATGRQGR
jgi:PAS domain S-box-containing protein